MTAGFNQAQSRALALSVKISGVASFLASSMIVVSVCRQRNRNTLSRLVLAVSLCDCISSIWIGLSTWPIPAEDQIDVTWAIGNRTICTIQGFFAQATISSPLYNATMSVYFLLVIRYGWRDSSTRKVEPWLHAFPLVFGLGTAVTALVLNRYGNTVFWCWITGEIYQGAFFYFPLWIAIFVVTVSCILVYLAVRRAEAASKLYRFPQIGDTEDQNETKHEGSNAVSTNVEASSNQRRGTILPTRDSLASVIGQTKRTRQVASQCFWFSGAFYFTWLSISVRVSIASTRMLLTFHVQVTQIVLSSQDFQKKPISSFFPLLLLAATTAPLQGVANAIVYLQPRIREQRRLDGDASLSAIIWRALFQAL